MGGVAGALAACDTGKTVILTEETDWIGGQITSQGVAALDEHPHIEYYGGTRTYYALREGIRAEYRQTYALADAPPDLNPGGGWVSKLCFEPRVALKVLNGMLSPHIASGKLRILLNQRPVAAQMDGSQVVSVTVESGTSGEQTEIRAAYFLDATELGDLLPLTNTAYVTGAEAKSDTGDDLAPDEARPYETQSFTYTFAVEWREGESHISPKPQGYETFREEQPYSLILEHKDGSPRPFLFFGGELPFWTYRRMLDGALLNTTDVAQINWHSNDYFGGTITDVSEEEKAKQLGIAKQLSLGFLHWMQTECPRDDGGTGYPELKLRPDVMGTADGLAKHPYIREARRIKALKRVVDKDILAEYQPGARSGNFHDSIGVGWYSMDLHPCVGNPKANMFEPTKPYQIPLGMLIPQETKNLIAANKNIGTTHYSNGSYRLHPVEWNIGEAAGMLAAQCMNTATTPQALHGDDAALLQLQILLAARGVPLGWATDIPQSDALFQPTQILLAQGVIKENGRLYADTAIHPDQPISTADVALEALSPAFRPEALPETWRALCAAVAPQLA